MKLIPALHADGGGCVQSQPDGDTKTQSSNNMLQCNSHFLFFNTCGASADISGRSLMILMIGSLLTVSALLVQCLRETLVDVTLNSEPEENIPSCLEIIPSIYCVDMLLRTKPVE